MKRGFLTIVITLILIASYGQEKNNEKVQGKITGKVLDSSSGLPLDYSTITLFAAGKNKPLNGTTSDSAGNFILTNIPSGSFSITVEFIGYKSFNITDININQKKQLIDLKNILLSPNIIPWVKFSYKVILCPKIL